MARKKVNLQWISNDSTRRVAYKKRCKSLMKKTDELTKLCGIKACVVVYGEGETTTTKPEVWPSVSDARHVLKKFKSMPEMGRFKKAHNQEDFLHGRVSKLRDQVCKLELVNREHDTSRLLHESMDGRRPGLVQTTVEELTNLDQMVDAKMAKVKELLLQEHGVAQGALPKFPLPSSSQPQGSYTYTDQMQMLAESGEHQPPPQGWPTELTSNQGQLGDGVCNAFASTSSGCVGPSGYGGDMNQIFDLGCFSGFPWAQEDIPAME